MKKLLISVALILLSLNINAAGCNSSAPSMRTIFNSVAVPTIGDAQKRMRYAQKEYNNCQYESAFRQFEICSNGTNYTKWHCKVYMGMMYLKGIGTKQNTWKAKSDMENILRISHIANLPTEQLRLAKRVLADATYQLKNEAEEERKKSEEFNAKKIKKQQADAEKAGYKSYAEMQIDIKKKADIKKVKEKNKTVNKKIALLPPKSELQEAQNFLNDIQVFVKNNKDQFDILEVTDFMIQTKSILDGSFNAKDKKNIEAFKQFANSSYAFKSFRTEQLNRENQKNAKKIDKSMRTLKLNLTTLQNNYDNAVFLSDIIKLEQASKRTLDNPKTLSELNDAIKSTRLLLDEMTNYRKQTKIANQQLLYLITYLSENMTSDFAPQVMSSIKKLKNATNQETQIAILKKNESLSIFLDTVITEVRLFIIANIPK